MMAEENSGTEAMRSEPAAERDTGGRRERAPATPSAGQTINAGSERRAARTASGREQQQQYIISPRAAATLHPMLAPLSEQALEDALKLDPRVQHLRAVRALGGLNRLAVDSVAPQDVHVVRMNPEIAAEVSQRLGHLAYIEQDEVLCLAAPAATVALPVLGVAAPATTAFRLTVAVLGRDDTPLPDARVLLLGRQSSTQGVTDRSGQILLALPGETADSVRGIAVTPKANYWSLWLPGPMEAREETATITLPPLDQEFHGSRFAGFAGFPANGLVGWGLLATGVDHLQSDLQGQGVTVALVDTGIAATHPDLQGQVDGGYNVLKQRADGFDRDQEGHGTHCAGIIAARHRGEGMRGIAPAARLRSYTVYPGGRSSDLIDALNRCIQDNVDVIHLGLTSDAFSELVEQRIAQAKQQGIPCIVAAGNVGVGVQYPACSPNVLAVTAIGKQGTFPPGSWQAAEAPPPATSGADEYFSPAFTCYGPEVSVCAPGVAVVSCAPPTAYAVVDGTSVAAAHAAGIAALVLARHPDFQGPYRERNARRVDRLFEILMQGASPLALGPSSVWSTGAGLVNAIGSLSVPPAAVFPQSGPSPIVNPQMWADLVPGAGLSNGHSAASLRSARVTQSLPQPRAGSAVPANPLSSEDVANVLGAVAAAVTRSLISL